MALSDVFVFKLGDNGTELNTDANSKPFVDITRVYGFDSAPIRETERDHEGVDGGYLDAEFEKGRPLMMDGYAYADPTTLETYLDKLKAEWAPSSTPVPFYFRAPGQGDRVMFVKPRGMRYDWAAERRYGCEQCQFVFYAEDPRIYDATLLSTVIVYGGVGGIGYNFVTWRDTFTRSVSAGLGTSDTGHTYTLTGTAANFNVNGSAFALTMAAATGSAYFAKPNVTAAINQYAFIQGLALSATPTGGSISSYLDLRQIDANNFYRAEIIFTTSNTVQLQLSKVVGGVTTVIASAATIGGLTATTPLAVRFEISQGAGDGSTGVLNIRVWQQGTAEPSTWNFEVKDSSLTAAGGTRLGAQRNAGNTNSSPTMTWDSVQWWEGFGFNLDFGGGQVPTGGVVVNAGNRPTPAVFTIAGPIDNPIIANDTLSKTLAFQISLSASETLVIDTINKTVLLNGVTNRRSTLIAPTWFLLAPGGNFIRFGGSSAGAPTLTVQYRSAWR